MANELTGDFDVVAEFSIPAANRVLAAMHRAKRFPHSMSIQVNPGLSAEDRAALQADRLDERVDQYGDALDDPMYLAQPPRSLRNALPDDPGPFAVDALVNPAFGGRNVFERPTDLRGVAQLQLSPPEVIPGDSETRITLQMQMMARYFPAPDTRIMPEFLRGTIQIGADVDRVASPRGNVIDVDLRGASLDVVFTPAFSDRTLDPSDRKAIDTVIRNSIRTSFEPSTAPLPEGQQIQLKAMPGELPAIGVLINMGGGFGDPASASNVFLRDGDHFALGVSSDFFVEPIKSVVNGAVDQSGFRSFNIEVKVQFLFWTRTIIFQCRVDQVNVELLDAPFPGRIRVSIRLLVGGFSFRIRQLLILNHTPDTAYLSYDADVSLELTQGSMTSNIFDRFKAEALPIFRKIRDDAIKAVQAGVQTMFDVNKNLGVFLNSLMNPIAPKRKEGAEPPEAIAPQLEYTSLEIKNSGIILRGSLAVPDWLAAQVVMTRIPPYRSRANEPTGAHDPFSVLDDRFSRIGDVFQGGRSTHDYSALLSWIPGGTIQHYNWHVPGQLPLAGQPDANKFVLMNPPDIPVRSFASGIIPICLTVTGTRWTASGPVVPEPVSATMCGVSTNPWGVFNDIVSIASPGGDNKRIPDLPLIERTPQGTFEVTGHTSPWLSLRAGEARSSLIVHFADERTAGNLEFFTQALEQSERPDAPAAVLAVLSREQLARAKPPEGVTLAEDQDGAWNQVFGVEIQRRPATLLIGMEGKVLWQRQGELDRGELVTALKTYLQAGEIVPPRLMRSSVRLGHPPPNFLFQYEPGRELTLRKLAGRRVVLVFWKSSSKPSVEIVHRLQDSAGNAGDRGPVVLAINDGDPPELVKKTADENTLTACVIPDPLRNISAAYGLSVWPTTVFIDEFGLVRDVRFGRFSDVERPSSAKE